MIKNKSVLTEEKNVKFSTDIYAFRLPSPTIWGIVGLCIGIAILVCAFCVKDFLPMGLTIGIIILLMSVVLMFSMSFMKMSAKKVFEKNAKGLKEMEFDYLFEDDNIVITDGNGVELAAGGYDNILEVFDTKQAFYLMLEPYFGFVVDKDGFLEGDAEQLAQLLKTKPLKYIDFEMQKNKHKNNK